MKVETRIENIMVETALTEKQACKRQEREPATEQAN